LVLHLWVEDHDRVLRGRIVEGPGAPRAARGVEAIAAIVHASLVRIEEDLAGQADAPGPGRPAD
jgi:hypothetical protein